MTQTASILEEVKKPLPCPWCKSNVRVEFDIGTPHVACFKCKATGPDKRNEEEAIEAWDAVISRIEQLEAERRWIPVSEGLPEKGESVLIWRTFTKGGSMTIGGMGFDGEWYDFDVTDALTHVTHWKPTPPNP